MHCVTVKMKLKNLKEVLTDFNVSRKGTKQYCNEEPTKRKIVQMMVERRFKCFTGILGRLKYPKEKEQYFCS